MIPFTDEEIEATLELVTESISIGNLEQRARNIGICTSRPIVMHLLWTQKLQTDLSFGLSTKSEVWR